MKQYTGKIKLIAEHTTFSWLYFSCKLRKRVFSATKKRIAKYNFDFSKYFAIE